MLLCLDIGNTNITLGLFQGEKIRATWRIATDVNKMPDEYGALLLTLLPHEGIALDAIKHAAICSVVPPLAPTFEELCRHYFRVDPLVVEAGTKTGVRVLYDDPRAVGADRIVDAAAAHHLYGGPVIVVDFGTATVFDAVNKDGDYLGGAIAPGIGISTDALFQRAAKLPRIELVRPKTAIGKNTVTSMQSGIVFGYIGLVEGVIQRFQKELGGNAKVVATGGFAQLIAKESSLVDVINLDLTLEGLRMVYELNPRE